MKRNTHRHWEKQLNQQRQQRRRLEETVEELGELRVGLRFNQTAVS